MTTKTLRRPMAKKKEKAGRVEFTAPPEWVKRLQGHADRKGISLASLIKLWLTERMTVEEESTTKRGE